jgi:hypothetical protein
MTPCLTWERLVCQLKPQTQRHNAFNPSLTRVQGLLLISRNIANHIKINLALSKFIPAFSMISSNSLNHMLMGRNSLTATMWIKLLDRRTLRDYHQSSMRSRKASMLLTLMSLCLRASREAIIGLRLLKIKKIILSVFQMQSVIQLKRLWIHRILWWTHLMWLKCIKRPMETLLQESRKIETINGP